MDYHYHIYSGTVPKKAKPLVYKFGRSRNIRLIVSKTGFSLKVCRTVKKSGPEILQDLLVRDAFRKIAKLQLIQYNRISNQPVFVEINKDRE